jgi:hypothetical protein
MKITKHTNVRILETSSCIDPMVEKKGAIINQKKIFLNKN